MRWLILFCFYFAADSGDKTYPIDGPVFVVWAMGHLDTKKEPTFHDYYPKGDVKLDLNKKEPGTFAFS